MREHIIFKVNFFISIVLTSIFPADTDLAYADAPTICLLSPTGNELYISGTTKLIQWSSPDYDPLDPDHENIWEVNLYYRWLPSGNINWISMSDDFVRGQHSWTVPEPPKGANEGFLQVLVRYEIEGGTIAAEKYSGTVHVIAARAVDSVPAVGITTPHPVASPLQTQPPTCFDHLTVHGGDIMIIRWNMTGCDSAPTPNQLKIQYTNEAGLPSPTYTTIKTIYNPTCGFNFFNWTIPMVNTNRAGLQLIWTYETITGTETIAWTATRYPFEITTGDINLPPVADAGDDQSVRGRQFVYLRATDSYDPDGDPMTYHWQLVAGPGMYMDVVDINQYSDGPTATFWAPSVTYETSLTFKLSVTDSYHVPSTDLVEIAIRPDPNDLDGDWVSNDIDNCPEVANPGQEDRDRDNVGDICDNCPDTRNTDQVDTDGDRRGDACDPCSYDAGNDVDGDGLCSNLDNCPWHANPDQADYDSDGEGDACDCNDGFTGPNEAGMDCGVTLCGTACPNEVCQPLVVNGPSDTKIDVVIIPGDDYWSTLNYPQWLNPLRFASQDGLRDIIASYFTDPVLGTPDNRTKFNVWYTTSNRGTVNVDENGLCHWDAGSWRDDCPQGDIAFILHIAACRDYASGNVFSTEPGHPGTLLHESGHALFDLGDEYDDAPGCITHYFTSGNADRSNIWSSEEACRAHTSLNPDDCTEFTYCQDGWFKAQIGSTVMRNACVCMWGNDAERGVEHVMDIYPSSKRTSTKSFSTENGGKVFTGRFHYHSDGHVSLESMRVMYGTSPELKNRENGIRIMVEDEHGAALADFSIMDPRYQDFPEEPMGAGWIEETDFSLTFPFFPQARRLKMTEGGNSLGQFDLTISLESFCDEFPNDQFCECQADMDKDHDIDGVDLSAFVAYYHQGAIEADLNTDQWVDGNDISLFTAGYGRTDCIELEPLPDCNDGNPCTRDFFSVENGRCEHIEKRCFDGSQCTEDKCDPQTGACVYTMKACDDGNPCTTDWCDDFTGTCMNTPVECDDGNACTRDWCDEKTGKCETSPVQCDDNDPCTWDLCDKQAGCFHVDKVCDDQDLCTVDYCGPKGECIHEPDIGCQACCNVPPFGLCVDAPPITCKELGGAAMGNGTSCSTTPCPK